MKFWTTMLAFSCAFTAFHSCKPLPNDGIPFYLKLDSVNLTSTAAQGAATHRITDAWVEANADKLGTYELPCNFPVLQENTVRFTISAGIMESGQAGVRVIYPFYQPDTFSIIANRGEKYSHQPFFKYKPGALFAFQPEDFEFSSSFNGLVKIFSPDSNVAYGNSCGMISTALDSSQEASQIVKYPLPAGQEVWLETDYKCEVPFYIGFYANYTGGSVLRVPILFVTEKSSWNKLYVNLSNVVGSSRADTYNIYFEALRPYGSAGGAVYIDNVKVVHF